MILKSQTDYEIELWTGFECKIKECCIMFYESVWRPLIKYEIAEYAEKMSTLTDNQGIILCPDCIVNKLN